MTSSAGARRTALYEKHVALGAKMVDFAGWDMPLNYPAGVVAEHLTTRRHSGLFDVCHMGRFSVAGPGAVAFLQRVLTNDAATLEVGRSHYTLFCSGTGGAIDDAYLYRFFEGEYLLVVNAANRDEDWAHLRAELEGGQAEQAGSGQVELCDLSESLAMISLQGPASEDMITSMLEAGSLPESRRNSLSLATLAGEKIMLGRTGYTGEPLCFELFTPTIRAQAVWDLLVQAGASPCGLGARDTLRLEAGLPLYGHEQGLDAEGREIPLLSCPVAAYGVNLSTTRGDFLGRAALTRQQEAYQSMASGDYSLMADLPRMIRAVAVTGRGVARAGSPVLRDGKAIGWVTSGTMVPYFKSAVLGVDGPPEGEHELRSISLAYLDSDVSVDDTVSIDIRGKLVEAVVVDRHLRTDRPPYARPVVYRSQA